MELQFDCDCGASVSTFTRGGDTVADFTIECDDCGALYTVTVTQIQQGQP